MKRIIVLSLIVVCSAFALENDFSLSVSLSGAFQQTYTNNTMFSTLPGYLVSENCVFENATIKSGLSCLYHNTGLYLSGEKLIGHYQLKKYFIFSGGLMQSIPLSEKSALALHLGTTWHSVDAAINASMDFFVATHYKSELGLDIGLSFSHKLSEKTSILAEVNYNYNKHYIDSPSTDPENILKYKFQTISLNAGVMFSLF